MIDKSIRQHYAIQGGGPNYLGKQKMVKAPKKWKSSPDHPDTELAYITEPEKQVLIALNLHGGLEDGKPNRGPSGIISLQGDMGGYGGTGGSSGGNGPETRSPQASRAREEKAKKDKERANIREQARTKITAPKTTPKDEVKNPFEETGQTKKEQAKIASDVQELRDKVKTFDQDFTPELYVSLDKYMKDKGLYSSGDVEEKTEPKIDVGFQEILRKQKIASDLKTKQQDPRYGQFFRPTPIVEKPKFFDTGLGKVVKNVGLGIVAPQLLAGTKLAPLYSGYRTAKTLSNVADTLGWGKPKDIMSTFTSNLTPGINLTKKTSRSKAEPPSSGKDGREDGIMQAQAPKNILEENIQKFSPRQLDLIRQRYEQLQQVMKTGMFGNHRLTIDELAKLTQVSKQMEAFLVNPEGIMGVS